jgi:small subunit ribosomal protein S8
MHTDVVADLLTRIRNAAAVKKRIVEVPASKLKLGIVAVLFEEGFIEKYKLFERKSAHNNKPYDVIKIALKYQFKESAITSIVRVSRPGLRRYCSVADIPRVQNGLGICILTTSKGIMTGKKAQALNVGGEILCYVY